MSEITDRGKVKDGYLVLWRGIDEFVSTVFESLEDAIRYTKINDRAFDYGRNGAIIVKAQKLYEVALERVERTSI
jgi:hypothetical protein